MTKSKTPAHIFLTGEKQVGKSTLVSSVLATTKLRYKGLRSISVFDENNDRNVYIIPANKGKAPINSPTQETPADTADHQGNPLSQETPALVGICSNHHIVAKKPEVFDSIGCRLLEPGKDTQLIVIDEIGNMESNARLYSVKVMSLLERTDIRVLGVVQKMARTELAETIRNHPNVRIIEVDEGNREELVKVILSLLQS